MSPETESCLDKKQLVHKIGTGFILRVTVQGFCGLFNTGIHQMSL